MVLFMLINLALLFSQTCIDEYTLSLKFSHIILTSTNLTFSVYRTPQLVAYNPVIARCSDYNNCSNSKS